MKSLFEEKRSEVERLSVDLSPLGGSVGIVDVFHTSLRQNNQVLRLSFLDVRKEEGAFEGGREGVGGRVGCSEGNGDYRVTRS